jgi:ATP-dependent Clp protease protease subunit
MGEIYQPIDNIYNEMVVQDALKRRKLHLNDDVDEISMFKLMYYMDKIKQKDDSEGLELGKRQPIRIIINSYGGVIYDCLALLSKIERFQQEYKYKIITELTGKGMSCGAFIFCFGDERLINRFGTLLFHQLSAGHYGNYTQLKIGHDEDVRLQTLINDLIVKKTSIPRELLEQKIDGKDWYLSPEDCIKYDVATKII